MEFSYDEIDGDVLIIRADGGLNADTAATFLHDIEALLRAGLRKIIVDCERLEVISSAGVGALIRLHRLAADHDGEVKIAGAGGVIVQVIRLMRLESLFSMEPDVNRARLAFRPTTP